MEQFLLVCHLTALYEAQEGSQVEKQAQAAWDSLQETPAANAEHMETAIEG